MPKPEFDNGLSKSQEEQLYLLIEECSEVIQAAGKSLRHGYGAMHPAGKESNSAALLREVHDLTAVLAMMNITGNIDDLDHELVLAAMKGKVRWSHHQDPAILEEMEREDG